MNNPDQGGEDPPRDPIVGDPQAPPPEPWFIRDLRAQRTAAADAVPAAAPGEPTGGMTGDRILGPADRLAPPVDAPERGRRIWPYVLVAGFAAVVALALWLSAVPPSGGADSLPAARVAPSVAVPTSDAVANTSAGLCTTPATLGRLRSLITIAAARAGGDPAELAQAAAGLSLSVTETPDTSGEAGAVDCRGWLSLVQPGAAPASAAVSFRALQIDGGEARISILQGATPIVAALAATVAATPDAAAETAEIPFAPSSEYSQPAAPVPMAEPRFSDPSFDCRRVTSRANRAICGSDRLAALDRAMAGEFAAVAGDADPETRADLEDGRRDFLARIQRCDDNDCIADVYGDRIEELRSYR